MFKVKKQNLLLIAGIVWLFAGFNVARLGVLSYGLISPSWLTYLLSVLVFAAFGGMFVTMSSKHTARILAYEDMRPFWNFFDTKSYLIMAFMMSAGIGLRAANLVPQVFVAFFYTGLGCALMGAGIVFVKNYLEYGKNRADSAGI
jgi:hypothetical protein